MNTPHQSSGVELLPCPFCENTKFHRNTKAKGYFEKKALERSGKPSSNHLIRCTKCGAKGPLSHSVEEAEAAWNNRALITPEQYNRICANIRATERVRAGS